jgi:hypothetical protein
MRYFYLLDANGTYKRVPITSHHGYKKHLGVGYVKLPCGTDFLCYASTDNKDANCGDVVQPNPWESFIRKWGGSNMEQYKPTFDRCVFRGIGRRPINKGMIRELLMCAMARQQSTKIAIPISNSVDDTLSTTEELHSDIANSGANVEIVREVVRYAIEPAQKNAIPISNSVDDTFSTTEELHSDTANSGANVEIGTDTNVDSAPEWSTTDLASSQKHVDALPPLYTPI